MKLKTFLILFLTLIFVSIVFAQEIKFPVPKEEPIVRVGIILEEDNKEKLETDVLAGEYTIIADGRHTALNLSTLNTLSFIVENGQILCNIKEKTIAGGNKVVSIEKKNKEEKISPKSGILVKNCVAGRGFHWEKPVNLSLPFKLEFHQVNGKLILVNELPMEPYLACVVTSEMSGECPAEFIKAQATSARSWMRVSFKKRFPNKPYDVCNDDLSQRYQGTTYLSENVANDIAETRGMFLVLEDGEVCNAFYSKCCGGIIEKPSNIFGSKSIGPSDITDAPKDSKSNRFNPVTEDKAREWVSGDWLKETDSFCSPKYLEGKNLKRYLGAVDEKGSYYRWKVVYSQEEIVKTLKEKAHLEDITEFVDFVPGERGNSGRLLKLDIIYKTKSGEEKTLKIPSQYLIRKYLHEKFLFSSAFVWDYEKNENDKIEKVILTGAGWGHGVGLCQMGALGMALDGYSYEEILKQYYADTTLVKGY